MDCLGGGMLSGPSAYRHHNDDGPHSQGAGKKQQDVGCRAWLA
jgi:hypothetical protein